MSCHAHSSFRELNKITADGAPIPRIDVVLTSAGQCKCFSKFDFTNGYWQVPVAEDSCEKTAFSSISGLYHLVCMPFSIKIAPAVFARLMRAVLCDVENVYHYFDDVVIVRTRGISISSLCGVYLTEYKAPI